MGSVAVKRGKAQASAEVLESSRHSGAEAFKQDACQANNSSNHCHNCGVEARSRRRDFSEQAWTVLLLWNEINPAAVDRPICSECYDEMRDILIDRTDEIDAAMQESDKVAKIKEQLSHLAS